MNDPHQQIEQITSKVVALGTFEGEPDHSLLSDGAAPSPSFPVDCMGSATSWLIQTASGKGVRPDYVAGSLFAGVSALIGKIFTVRVTDEWEEPCNLWCFAVGGPASGKTPASAPVRSELRRLEDEMREDHESRLEHRMFMVDQDIAACSKEQKRELEAELEDLKAQKKAPPRLYAQDATKEALYRIEQRAPRGLLVDHDELAGLIENMGGYSGGNARAYYLAGHRHQSFTVDRVGDGGSAIIKNHLLSVHGGIQPDKLASLLLKSTDDDGFAARALIFAPAVMRNGGIPRGAKTSGLRRAFSRLVKTEPAANERPHMLQLDDSAYELLDSWYANTHEPRKIEAKGKLGSALGKMDAQCIRIAGILHLIDWAFADKETDRPNLIIRADHVRAAVEMVENYFVPQCIRIYEGLDSEPSERMAVEILKKARKRGENSFDKGKILRAWKLEGYRSRNPYEKPNAIRDAAIEILLDANWIIQGPGSGTKTITYRFNPALFSKDGSAQ